MAARLPVSMACTASMCATSNIPPDIPQPKASGRGKGCPSPPRTDRRQLTRCWWQADSKPRCLLAAEMASSTQNNAVQRPNISYLISLAPMLRPPCCCPRAVPVLPSAIREPASSDATSSPAALSRPRALAPNCSRAQSCSVETYPTHSCRAMSMCRRHHRTPPARALAAWGPEHEAC